MPQVERPDQHELDEGGEDRAGSGAAERREDEAQRDRVNRGEVRVREPGDVRADGQERAVREVQHAHQAIDQRETGRDQKEEHRGGEATERLREEK